MATIIAHTAVVDPRAELDDEVRIGHHEVVRRRHLGRVPQPCGHTGARGAIEAGSPPEKSPGHPLRFSVSLWRLDGGPVRGTKARNAGEHRSTSGRERQGHREGDGGAVLNRGQSAPVRGSFAEDFQP